MIRVERPPAPVALFGPGSKAAQERADAVAHFATPVVAPAKRKAFKYTAYKAAPVRAALEKIFNGKCAYCEITYGGAPLDVEHYRPKAKIAEMDLGTLSANGAKIEPGYYWLAASWTNLLLSCIHCNRPATHAFAGAKNAVAGKFNYFPLPQGAARALDPNVDVEALERPLLLDPCRDQPEEHLEYGPKGTIRPKARPDGVDLRARVSIRVYGLQRDPLVREREETQVLLGLRIAETRKALAALAANPGDLQARQEYDAKIAEIEKHYLAPQRRFLGLCRQMVEEQLVRIMQP